MKIIDPHLHLFNLELGDYQWLKADNPPFWPDKKVIERDFHQQDLNLTSPCQLAGFVHIEAGFDNQQPWREIAWLEQHCTLPFRAIAGINLLLSSNDFQQHLNKLSQYQSVVGVRDILDENAVDYLSNNQVQQNLAELAQQQLIFECQMLLTDTQATKELISVVTALPTLSIVINHAGFPPEHTESALWQEWQNNMLALSHFENITIKCSGFEMINRQYCASWQQLIINHCLNTFGMSRTMLASNFPLCLFKESYQKNWLSYQQNLSLSTSELELLSYKNAQRIYKLPIQACLKDNKSTL